MCLFNGDEFGGVSSTDTRFTVGDSLIGHGELAEVEADHLGFDFDLGEAFSVVDVDDGLDHGGEDDAVSQVGFNGLGLVQGRAVFLGVDQLLDELAVLGQQLPAESSSLSGLEQFAK